MILNVFFFPCSFITQAVSGCVGTGAGVGARKDREVIKVWSVNSRVHISTNDNEDRVLRASLFDAFPL